MQVSVEDFLPSHNLLLHIFFNGAWDIWAWGIGHGALGMNINLLPVL
ncbi:hypothetical protein [Nostoc sp. CMAA1605]|nr:hypothetical protein [Nostoc sp. CMAA1605]